MRKAIATIFAILAILAAISRATGNDPIHDAANRLAATYAVQTQEAGR
jgi:hypothetical protein